MPAILQPSRRIIRPDEKPPFEFTQRYGLDWRNSLISLQGLVGCWIMNEGAGNEVYDLSRNGLNGTFVGTTSWSSGKFGSALSLDGDSDYVNVGDNDLFDFGSGDFAFSIWCQRLDTGVIDPLIAKDKVSSRQFTFFINNTDKVRIMYWVGAAAVYLDTTATITDSSWHHYFGQRAGNSFEIYIDGVLSESGTTSGSHGTMDSFTNDVRIGAREISAEYTRGGLDIPIIFNRSLSASEVVLLSQVPFCILPRPYPYIIGGKSAAAPSLSIPVAMNQLRTQKVA